LFFFSPVSKPRWKTGLVVFGEFSRAAWAGHNFPGTRPFGWVGGCFLRRAWVGEREKNGVGGGLFTAPFFHKTRLRRLLCCPQGRGARWGGARGGPGFRGPGPGECSKGFRPVGGGGFSPPPGGVKRGGARQPALGAGGGGGGGNDFGATAVAGPREVEGGVRWGGPRGRRFFHWPWTPMKGSRRWGGRTGTREGAAGPTNRWYGLGREFVGGMGEERARAPREGPGGACPAFSLGNGPGRAVRGWGWGG